MVLFAQMSQLVKYLGTGATFYIDRTNKTHVIYIMTPLQCLLLEYKDTRQKDWKRMNKLSKSIETGIITDINGVCGALGDKIVWTPNNYARKRILEVTK